MNGSPLLVLIGFAAIGTAVITAVVYVRAQDQRARDARRTVLELGFGRSLTASQVESVVRAVIGLSRARTGLVGEESAVFEVAGTRSRITHRLHLPASAASSLTAQLRVAVPGIRITTLDKAQPVAVSAGVELRRGPAASDPKVADVLRITRSVLASAANLRGSETVVWQLVVLGGSTQLAPGVSAWELLTGRPAPAVTDTEVVRVALRLGAHAGTDKRTGGLLAGMLRSVASAGTPAARMTRRLLPRRTVADRIARAATPVLPAPLVASVAEVVALSGWPIDGPLVPALSLGGGVQLPADPSVPRKGRVLGRALVPDRPVAQPVAAASSHTLVVGPTGSGKSWLAARLFLDDVAAGRGGLVLDPKGSLVRTIAQRLPEEALSRVIYVDPLDEERPVPVPLLAREKGGIPELAADNLVGLLRHRYRDLGPRSTDILTSSLYALGRMPDSTLMDVLRLWSDERYRATVAAANRADPVLSGFFAWFNGLGVAERNFILAAPLNKLRPLLQRRLVRNVLAAPRASFTLGQALRDNSVVLVSLPDGQLGTDAASLIGQVLLARLWAAVQARRSRKPWTVLIDEAPRFTDSGTDLADVLARSREYGVGWTLVAQTLAQFPGDLQPVTANSARTKVVFRTSADDARRLAAEMGPAVTPDQLMSLGEFEAMGVVALGGSVSEPFTFRSEELGPVVPGRLKAVREASRHRYGVPREEIEAAFRTPIAEPDEPAGPIGRKPR